MSSANYPSLSTIPREAKFTNNLSKEAMSEKMVITHLFAQTVQCFSHKTCIQIERNGLCQRYTYAQTEELSRKAAAFLIDNGVKKGDFVLLVLNNCPEWVICYLGILYAGACSVPIDPQTTIKEIEDITADCKPKAVFTSEHIFSEKNFANLKIKLKIIIDLPLQPAEESNVISFEHIKKYAASRKTHFPEPIPDDNASLIYTSGTTGTPKGVLLSHHNFCSNVKSFEKFNLCTEKDILLALLPLFHSYAFISGLLVPILVGATVIYCPSLKTEDVALAIKDNNVTMVPSVPQFFSLLRNKIFTKYDKSPTIFKPLALFLTRLKARKFLGRTLKLFLSGGAYLEPAVAKDLLKLGIKLVEGYGLTETSPIVTLNLSPETKPGSVGKPIPDVKVRINNPDESGTGEILIKGPNVMKGYFKRPDLTKQVIKDEWFYSGDLGYLDNEGYLYITGRLKEVIVLSSGKNVYPGKLEAIYGSSPYIKELCILSKDNQRGLYAVVVPDFSYFRQMNIMNIRDKIKWELENTARELQPYNHIMGFTIIKGDLPRTRLGKIKRFELQKKYGTLKEPREAKEKTYSASDQSLIKLNTSKKIIQLLEKELNEDITLNDNLEIDLGIDSLSRIELAGKVEELLHIKIPDELIAEVFTIRELLSKIDTLKNTGAVEHAEKKVSSVWKELLRKLPPEELLRKIRLKPSILDKIITLISTKLLFCLLRILCRLKVEGTERLPYNRAYILCPNHASFLDGFIVSASIPYNVELNNFFLGYASYFEHPLVAWGIKLGRLIPLDPNIHFVKAMQISSYVLRNGKVMCMFPEGRRSIDENVQNFKKGVGILAKELNIPLVPVSINGSHFAWPRNRRLPRPYPLKITYGHPLSARELLKKATKEAEKDDYQKITDALREEVLNLNSNE